MAVTAESMHDAPSASGGKSAMGSPFCTPQGKKVYCLKDHSYHHCAHGEVPCCEDGSNPSHRGSHEGGDSDYQCSSTAEVTPEAPIQIVLDDMELASESRMENAVPGSYGYCMADAWNGQYHHDWAENKGHASYAFKVNVPVSGCYELEEYHPGKHSGLCSMYLPRNAKLDVKYLNDRSTTLSINQAVDGAQWNIVASFPFTKGIEGELKMSNHPGEECGTQETGCFWVVDAFRLTRTGDKCGDLDPAEYEPEPKMMMEASPVATTTDVVALSQQPQATEPETTKLVTTGRDGTLLLEASWSGVGSLQLKLEEHKGIMETALAAHLGYNSVEILSIWKQSRRLHGQEGHAEHVKINFIAWDAMIGSSSQKNLQQSLQEAFDQKGVGITFHSATASWDSPAVPKEPCNPGSVTSVIIVACAVGGVLFLLLVVVLMTHRKTKRDAAKNGSAHNIVTPDEVANDLERSVDEKKNVIVGKEVDEKEDMDATLSVSTGTPSINDEHSEDSNTVAHSDSLQQEPETLVETQVDQEQIMVAM